jgi:general secretion pathway protein K
VKMSRSGGFALVLVLWVLSLMTIMAGSFALSMRREAGTVAGNSNNAQAVAIAESGLAIAELMLMNPDQQQRWHTDGSIYQINYADSTVRIRLLSEAGKVDLNSADEALLRELMMHAPVDEELQTKLLNAILDWRDGDDLVRMDGAEKEEYQKAGLSYQPRNKPFQSVDELQMVLGVNEQIFKWLESRVTVHSEQTNVDTAQAAKEVLYVLPGIDVELIDQYIAARRENAINGLPPPPAPIVSGSGMAPAGQTGGNVPAAAVSGGAEQKGAMTVVAEAMLDDGTTAAIRALVKRQESPTGTSPFQVLKWQRNVAVDESLFTNEKDELLIGQYAEPQFNN